VALSATISKKSQSQLDRMKAVQGDKK
jgi:hypothetical protein